MRKTRLLLIGFGNVGEAFLHLLLRKQQALQQAYARELLITGVCTGTHGGALNPAGLDLKKLLLVRKGEGQLTDLSDQSPPEDTLSFIGACEADLMLEISPVNYLDGQPAVNHIRAGLKRGMHVVTANKGPVVHAFHELRQLAQDVQRKFYFESTVMDGAPLLSLWRETLPGAKLLSFRGVLNSTTNFILSEMEGGLTFEGALQKAQERGIAETDPAGDLEGWDAAIKVGVLATVLMGFPLTPDQIERRGITQIGPSQIRKAREAGKRWKLVCTAKRDGSEVRGSVQPMQVDLDDPLYHVTGTSSAITFHTDVLGPLTLLEENPGPETTAYGLLADLLNAVLLHG